MKYVEIPDFGPGAIADLESHDIEKVQFGLLSIAMYSGNFELAVSSIRRFVSHENEYIRGIAYECCSHVARLWKRLPDDLIDAVNDGLEDENDWAQGKAEFAADDLEVFIRGFRLRRKKI